MQWTMNNSLSGPLDFFFSFVLDHEAHGKRLSAWPLHRRINLNRRQSYAAKTRDVLELSNYVIRGGISLKKMGFKGRKKRKEKSAGPFSYLSSMMT